MRTFSLKQNIYSFILHAIFYVLPGKYFKMYIYLTIISMLHKIRFTEVDIDKVNSTKFVSMLNVSFNHDVMLFPEYTINLIWKDELLDQTVLVDTRLYKIREVLTDPAMMIQASDAIVNRIYNYLPYYDRLKLVSFNMKNEGSVKNDLKEVILFDC